MKPKFDILVPGTIATTGNPVIQACIWGYLWRRTMAVCIIFNCLSCLPLGKVGDHGPQGLGHRYSHIHPYCHSGVGRFDRCLEIEPAESEAAPAVFKLQVAGQSASDKPMQDCKWLADVRAFPALSCIILLYPALSCFRSRFEVSCKPFGSSWALLGRLWGSY